MFQIPVFFRPELVGPEQSFSPSAHKPAHVVDDWQRHSFPMLMLVPDPVTRAELCLAHDADYVDEVFAGTEPNGFGGYDPAVARSTLFTCGAMLAAARAAIANRQVAVAPVAGFHHAHHGFGAGYCTFNGLMVTAIRLKREGLVSKVGILDCDQHYGDGTADILDTLGIQWVRHVTVGRRLRRPAEAEGFLDQLPEIVDAFEGCDVLLYQAGADPHIDDPLGGWLTTDQLFRRDRLVFKSVQALGIPIAWNLAGGYQRDADGGIEPVLAIHRNTMRACTEVFTPKEGARARRATGRS